MARRTVLLLMFLGGTAAGAAAQRTPDPDTMLTRAERSGYRETSRYEDVVAFAHALAETSDRLHVTTFGYSFEGRPLPLVVYGEVPDATPQAVLASGRLRVLLQANIHAGEVEGKEALQILLRELTQGEYDAWADSLVLLVAPIYNADGNERVRLTNRPLQNGPIGGMGQRPNAQGLDLNRDHMKLESPEARSLVLLLDAYDPHVVVDLHATNGTVHAYHLTYSPPLHPNTHPAITGFLREVWLPAATRDMRRDYGWEMFHYGNIPSEEADAERGWYTFDHRPRFNNNYVGLRNRFAILGEAYAYASFEERIVATFGFLEALLDFAHAHAGRIRAITALADAETILRDSLATRARIARAPADATILLGDVVRDRHPLTGQPLLRRLDVQIPEVMPLYDRFAPSELEAVPAAYLVPPGLEDTIALLEAHGVAYQRLPRETALRVEEFHIDSMAIAERPFQGHHERTLFGAYLPTGRAVPAGTLVVPVDQPLGRLVFSLLEPRSDDGVVAWNVLDVALQGAAVYPIRRTSTPVR
ncbi:MAG: M14 family metallopeptidase [Longimicrobiales bacterium]